MAADEVKTKKAPEAITMNEEISKELVERLLADPEETIQTDNASEKEKKKATSEGLQRPKNK